MSPPSLSGIGEDAEREILEDDHLSRSCGERGGQRVVVGWSWARPCLAGRGDDLFSQYFSVKHSTVSNTNGVKLHSTVSNTKVAKISVGKDCQTVSTVEEMNVSDIKEVMWTNCVYSWRPWQSGTVVGKILSRNCLL